MFPESGERKKRFLLSGIESVYFPAAEFKDYNDLYFHVHAVPDAVSCHLCIRHGNWHGRDAEQQSGGSVAV